MNRAILLDRDGVINQDSIHYIKSVDEFIFLPGSLEALVALTAAGYRIGIATNQSGISRGYYDVKELAAIHDKMLKEVHLAGGNITAIEYCYHLPEAGCFCRKPKPGMLHALAKSLGCDLAETYFIGDRVSDVQAAEAAGAKPMIALSPMSDRTSLLNYPQVPVFISLARCVDYLLA